MPAAVVVDWVHAWIARTGAASAFKA